MARKLTRSSLKNKYQRNDVKYLYQYDYTLSCKEGGTDDVATSFLCKLVGVNESYLTEGETKHLTDIMSVLGFRQSDIIFYALSISGGAFRNQLKYLGVTDSLMFSDKLKWLLGAIKRDYGTSGYSAPAILSVNPVPLNNDTQLGTFISLGMDAYLLADEFISKFEKRPILPLTETHSIELEHASGFSDVFYYILGNQNFPGTFRLLPEQPVKCGDIPSLVSDMLCTARLSPNSALWTDYIEVHTGKQYVKDIVDKLYSYTRLLKAIHERDNNDYFTENIMFLIHPSGTCANDKRGVGVTSLVKKASGITLTDYSFLVSVIGRLSLFVPMREFGASLRILTYYRDNDYKDADKFLPAAGLTHSDIERAIDILLRMNADESVKKKLDRPIGSVLPDVYNSIMQDESPMGSVCIADSYNASYEAYLKYNKHILSDSPMRLQKDYKSTYSAFKDMCIHGLSLSTSFGADMYNTYLFVHPLFTGAARAVIHILNEHGILSDSEFSLCFDNEHNEIRSFPSFQIPFVENDGSTPFVAFKNAIPYHKNEQGYFDRFVCMEYLTNDLGAQIRVSNAMKYSRIADCKCKLICLVDSECDAYEFIVSRCFRMITSSNPSLVSFSQLYKNEDDSLSDVNDDYSHIMDKLLSDTFALPLFITKESVISYMYGDKGDAHPFVFTSLDIYKRILEDYGKADRGFVRFFRKNIEHMDLSCDIFRVSLIN